MSIFEFDEEEYTRLTREESWEDSRITTLQQNIEKLIKNMGLTAEQAMETLEISDADRKTILERL